MWGDVVFWGLWVGSPVGLFFVLDGLLRGPGAGSPWETFRPEGGVLSEWFRWGVVGAVVLGAVLVGVVLKGLGFAR